MEDRRQEKVDAGREKFAAYQKRKKKSLRQRDVQEKDEAPVETNLSDTSLGGLEESVCSSPSSVASMTEPSSNLVQELKAKVRELEDIISGQQAALEAARRSSQEQQTDYKTQIESYVSRLREYEGAVEERNSVIEQLTASLHTELMARKALQQQGDHLAQEVSLLERQLQATSELVQGHLWDTGVRPDQFLALQNKVLILEASLEQMEDVKAQLSAKEQELEKTAQELREHKSRSALEVQRLMEDVEKVHQRAAAEAVEQRKKLTEMEESFGLQLRMKEEYRRQAEEDKRLLKVAHEEELSALHQQYQHNVDHLCDKADTLELVNERSADYSELKQQVLRLSQELESSDRKLQETLQVNLSLNKAITEAQNHFEEELATIKKQSHEEHLALQQKTEGLWKQLEEAVLSNQRLSAELEKVKDGHARDVEALSTQLRESYERQQNLTVQLQELGQSKQLQEESYKQVIESLNQRLKEAAEAEESMPVVVMAHVENMKTENLKYKEQVNVLNVRLQESMKTSQSHERLLGDKNVELIVLKGEVGKLRSLLNLAAESESSLRQQVDTLTVQLQEAIQFKSSAEAYKMQNNELNSKIKELNEVLSSREQKIHECESEVKLLNSKLQELEDFRTLAEVYEEKIRSLNNEAEELSSYKDKVAALQSEIDSFKGNLNDMLQIFSVDEGAVITSEQHCISKRDVVNSEFSVDQFELLKMRFSYVLRQREEDATSYEKQIANLNSKLAENAQAAEKQALEWEERIMVYRERLESLSSQVCMVEEGQRAEVSRLQESHQAELQALKASFDEEMAALKIEMASQKVHDDEELEQRKCAFDAEMVRLKEAHNMKLVELDETYKSQLTLKDKNIKLLEEEVRQLSQEMGNKSTQLDSLQDKLKLLEEYKVKISRLECELEERKSVEWNADMNELELCKQQIEVLKSRLEEASASEQKHMETVTACQLQVDSYKQQVELLDSRCVDELAASQQEIDELQDRLMSSCVTEQELEQLRGQLAAKDEEAVNLHNQIKSLKATLEEKNECVKSLYAKLTASEAQLQELQTSQNNSVAELKGLKLLFDSNLTERNALLEEISFLQQEIKPCKKCEIQSSLEIELAKFRDENKALEKLLNEGKKREEQLTTDLAKHQSDIKALNSKIFQFEQGVTVAELKAKVEELMVDKLKLEGLLAGQHELISGIQQVQGGDSTNMQEITVQFLKTSSLMSGKDELQLAFRERVVELEQSLEKANKDNSQLTLKFMKAKELLRRLKEENNKTSAKNLELEAECERLRMQGEKTKQWQEQLSGLEQDNKELKAHLKSSLEDAASSKSHYDKLLLQCDEQHAIEVRELLTKVEIVTNELEQFKTQLSLREETLVALRLEFKAGQELQTVLQKQLFDNLGQNNVIKTLVLELSGQMKEVVMLKEKIQQAESRYKAVVAAKDKAELEMTEMQKVQEDLEDKLAKTSEEIRALKLENELLQSNDVILRPSQVLEDPELEFSKDLQQEKTLEVEEEWEEQSLPSWDDVLSDYERELLRQLASYREQHAGLAELLGTSGILQETMYQQKQQLLKKLQEKVCVDRRLEEQRTLYRNAQSKLQTLEQQLIEKENIRKELARQKRLLQQDLHDIEDRLRNQEGALSAQRLTLEAEIRARDLRIRHWQLQARSTQAAESVVDEAEEERLRGIRAQLDSAHARAVENLHRHYQEQLVVRDVYQLRSVLRIPREQMLSIVDLLNTQLQQQCSEAGCIKSVEGVMKFAENAAAEIVHKFETELEAAVGSHSSAPDENKKAQDHELRTMGSCGSNLLAVDDTLYWEYSSALKVVSHAWRDSYEKELNTILVALQDTWIREEVARSSRERDVVANIQSEAEALLATQELFVSALEGVEAKFVEFHRTSMARLQEVLESENARILEKMDQMRNVISSLQSDLQLVNQVTSPVRDVEKLRHELEVKHTKEMEELRQYFEQKCADMEKRYSEEVFSQHSRKLSGSSAGSAEELAADMYFTGGDHGQRVPVLTHICDSYSVEPSYKDLDEHYRTEYERRILEYSNKLEAAKVSLEEKYRNEMSALRSHYEQLILHPQRELKSVESQDSDSILPKQLEKKPEIVEEYFTENIIDELARISSEAAIHKVCVEAQMKEDALEEMEQRHCKMVDAATETQHVNDGDTQPQPEEKEHLAGMLEAQLSSGNLQDNFISVLEWLKKCASGTAMTGYLDHLAGLHEKEMKSLQSAFQNQALISESEKSPGPVPQELRVLQERFVGPLQLEIKRLKQELAALKIQDDKQLLMDQHDSHESVDFLIKERDELRHALAVLRCVVRELLDYCARCENELNSTLVEELSPADRVHLSPDTTVLASFVADDSLPSDASSISTLFRGELNRCLARLHSEASSVLTLSRSLVVGKELVGEGLCELVQTPRRLQLRDPARRSLSEPSSPPQKLIDEIRQERDRITEEARREKEDLQQQVRVDSSLGASNDHQVEAADKQLRSTRQFLEEQATEREQEREEFAREMAALQAQLRERERDRLERQRLLKEVECLDQQLKESASHLAESEAARTRIQEDLDTAAEKISNLREIIVELEESVENRAASEENLKQRLAALESLLHQQDESHRQLASELESLREESGQAQLAEHISALEEQLCRHRLHVEQFQSGSGAVRRMKAQIQELEAAVGRKARELESLHCVVTTNGSPISSPLSEDTSIREQLEVMRCSTPDHSRRETPSPVPLPLEELQRLQEKVQRLCRAEESAHKRIADLELELRSVKRREEEVTAERDVLQRQTEEQLLKISSLQARLDEQRRAVDSAHWLAVSELRSELLERTDEIHSLRDACDASHKEVKELRNLLEQARQQAAVQESEMLSLLEKMQSTAQEKEDQHRAIDSQESDMSLMNALLEDAREEQSFMQEELTSLKREFKQLQWLLSCHQTLSLSPQQQQQLSAMLQGVSFSPQSDLEAGVQSGKWPLHVDSQPRQCAEEVFRDAPEFSLSTSLPDTFQEQQTRGSVSEVQLNVADEDHQLKELQEKYSLLQNVEQENSELSCKTAELQEVNLALNNLQTENSSLVLKLEELSVKISTLQQQKLNLEQQVKDLSAQCSLLESLQQETNLLQEEIKTLRSKLSLAENLQSENVTLAKQAEELQSKCTTLETVQGENTLLVEQIEYLKNECSSLKNIKEENSQLLGRVDVFQTELLRLRNFEQENINLVEKVNSLETECLRVEHLQQENVLQAQKIAELQTVCSVLENLEEENKALTNKVEELKDENIQMKKLQDENVRLLHEVGEQCAVAKNIELENLAKSDKINQLEAQCSLVSRLQEQNNVLSQKLQKFQDECLVVENLQEENRGLTKKLEGLQIDELFVKKLKQESLYLYQRVKDLESDCVKLRLENTTLIQKLEELEAQCILLPELQKENASLLQQIHDLNVRCKFLERSHNEDERQAVVSAQDQELSILKLQEEKNILQEAYLKVLQDMENKHGSLDELSGQLQRELEESEKLDLSLLERLTSSDEDVPATEILEPSLGIILKKILASDISVLTFQELSLLHQLVCSATAAAVVQEGGGNPQTLLCNGLDTKARNKVSQLESLLSKERQLALELRSTLDGERLHAQELANHVRLQSQLLADMQVQQTNTQSSISRYTELLEMERNKNLSLEEKLTCERSITRQLQAALEVERQKLRSTRIQDCSLLELMRRQLDVAVENEEKLHRQLQEGAHETNAALQRRCMELEARVSQLEKDLSQEREAAEQHQQVCSEEGAAVLRNQLEAVEANLFSLIREVPADDDSDTDLQRRVAGLKEKVQQLSTTYVPDALEERLAPLRQREQQLLEELGAAQRQVGELRTALVVRDQRLVTARNQLAALGRELSASRSREAELERRLTPEGLEGCGVSGKVNHDEWQDQKADQEGLTSARSHSHMNGAEPQQLDDLQERMTHLFGKYLRSESYRKSLVWQKRYLLVVLTSYQDCQKATLSQLALIAGHMPSQTQPSPRRRFRVAVVAVIVIQRMRYLVRRWRHGRRIGRSAIISRPSCECVGSVPRKKWGQSSLSPPSRDLGAPWHSSRQHRPWRLGENGCVTLLEPNTVVHYTMRCDNIQRQLGLATST